MRLIWRLDGGRCFRFSSVTNYGDTRLVRRACCLAPDWKHGSLRVALCVRLVHVAGGSSWNGRTYPPKDRVREPACPLKSSAPDSRSVYAGRLRNKSRITEKKSRVRVYLRVTYGQHTWRWTHGNDTTIRSNHHLLLPLSVTPSFTSCTFLMPLRTGIKSRGPVVSYTQVGLPDRFSRQRPCLLLLV